MAVIYSIRDSEVRITNQRKQDEDAMRNMEAFNQSVLNSMPANVAVLDANGTIIQVNQEWKRFALENGTYDPVNAYLQVNYLDVCRRAVASGEPTAEGAQECLDKLLALLEGAVEQFDLEYACHSPEEQRWFLLRAAPVTGGEGSVVLSHINVTKLKRAEITIREQAKRLAEADRRKDEFLAMLAHELRNPLAPIRNATQVLHMSGPLDPAQERQRSIIDRQVTHMARLLDDLLDVSRITLGKIELKRRRLLLADVLLQAIETAMPLVETRHHALTFTAPSGALCVEGDPDRLAQAVSNLLTNAAKYTEEGGQIWLETSREGAWAVVRVRDTGMGIAPEMLPRLFDLFAQANRTLGHAQGGLGIGLTLVERLVKMHGGRVEARSSGTGQGSEFTLRLPALPEEVCIEEQRGGPPPGEWPVEARRILVVDDVVDSATSLADLIELWGHEVRTAFDGLAALEMVRAFRPEVVLLDIGMPEVDGYEVARRLRAEHGQEGMVLVALTGYGQSEDQRLALEAGFDRHLVKPVDIDALRELLIHTMA